MAVDRDRLAAARQALADLGVTVADLQAHHDRPAVPTVAAYLPQVLAAQSRRWVHLARCVCRTRL